MTNWILCWKVYMLDKIGIKQESEKRASLIVIWIINVNVEISGD